MNLPDYHFLPAPLWLITILHIVTLTLHFLAMNFMLGGIVVLLFGGLRKSEQHEVVPTFFKLFPSAMAATVSFGVAPLLFVQLTYPHQVYSAAIVSGWFWLAVVGVVILAYYFLYAAAFSRAPGKRPSVYLALAGIGMLYVAFTYSSVFSLAERPDLMMSVYAANQSGVVINPDVGTYLWRWLHMLLGAVTVGAFFIGALGRTSDEIYALGKRFFVGAMMAAMVLGMVYLITLGDYLLPYMRSAAVWWLLVSVILSLGALHFFFRRKFLLSGSMLTVSLAGMIINRHILRQLQLDAHYDPASVPVNPQWSVFVVFLICFVVAAGLLWYMLRLFFSKHR